MNHFRFYIFSLFFLLSNNAFTQDCGCNACQIPVIANATRTFLLFVDGATYNNLDGVNQGVCSVDIDFAHDFIADLQITLKSPNGISVPLVRSHNLTDTSYFSRWNISFVNCSTPAAPDPGRAAVFSQNTNWSQSSTFTGDYYPSENACLSSFNSGTVNGYWSLTVSSPGYRGTGFIYGFKINFCKPDGLICNGLQYMTDGGESCLDPVPLPTDFSEFYGNTAIYNPDFAYDFCGSIENDQWYTFVSKCTETIFTVTPGYCINGDGIQVALYENCNTSPIACAGGCQFCGWAPWTIQATTIPGHQYYLVIDGFSGDGCDFIFSPPPGCVGDLATPMPLPPLSGCKGDSLPLALTEIPFGASGYIWKAYNGALVNGQTEVTIPGPENIFVSFTFGDDLGKVCVAAYNFTDTSQFVCRTYHSDTSQTIIENAVVCYDALPYFSEYSDYDVPPLSAAGDYAFVLHNFVNEQGVLLNCPVNLKIHLTIEGGYSVLPPVVAIGQAYTLPNGEEVSSSGPYFWQEQLPSGCTNDHQQGIYLIDYQYQSDGCAPDTVSYILPGSITLECPGGTPGSVSGVGLKKVVYQNEGEYDLIAHLGALAFTFPDTIHIDFQPPAMADFTAELQLNVLTLHNASQNATSYLWDFGDGSSSMEENPIHTYAASGNYLVTLTAIGPCGTAVDTVTVSIAGQAPAADFTASPQAGCIPLVVQFQDHSTGSPVSWNWVFPGGTPAGSTEQNPAVIYLIPGVYEVSLTVGNAFGQSTVSQPAFISTDPLPTANFSTTLNALEVLFTNQSLNADTYQWEFGDGVTSTETSPTHTYGAAGTYLVKLYSTNTCGTTILESLVTVTTSDVHTPDAFAFLSVSPNPSQGTCRLEIRDAPASFLHLRLFNALGQELERRDLGIFDGVMQTTLHFEPLPSGVYWLGVDTGLKSAWVKWVIDAAGK